MEFLILFGAVVFGIALGWKFREIHATNTLKRLSQVVKKEIDDQKADRIQVSIEHHNNHFYVYDKDNNKFLAQAGTRDELEEVLMERFPGKRFACSEENLKEVGFLP